MCSSTLLHKSLPPEKSVAAKMAAEEPTTVAPYTRRGELWPYAASVALVLLFYLPWLLPNSSLAMGDYEEYFIPTRGYATLRLRSGELPQWTDAIAGGFPILSDPQIATFYPGNMLFAALVSNPAQGWVMDTFVILHLIALALGATCLARSLGLSRIASVFVSVVVSLNTYNVMHLGHIVIIQVLAMGVWGMTCMVRALNNATRDENEKRLLPSIKWSVAAGLFMCSAVLLGHPQTAFYLFITTGAGAVALAFFRNIETPLSRRASWFFLAAIVVIPFVIGVAGAMVQLLPTRALLAEGDRAFGEMTPELAMSNSYPPRQILGILFPGLYQPMLWRVGDRLHDFLYGFWGSPAGHEYHFAIGLTAFVTGLFGWLSHLRRPLAHVLFFGAALMMLLCVGKYGPVYPWLFEHVRFFHTMRIPSRALWIVFMAWALLGGMGITAMGERSRSRLRRPAMLTGIIGLLIVTCSVGTLLRARLDTASITDALYRLLVAHDGLKPDKNLFAASISDQLIIAFTLVLLVSAVLLALSRSSQRSRPIFASILVVLSFGEFCLFGYHRNVMRGYKGFTLPDRFIHETLAQQPLARATGYSLPSWVGRNWGMLSGTEYANPYMGFALNATRAFLPNEQVPAGRADAERQHDIFNIRYAAISARDFPIQLGNRIVVLPDANWIELASNMGTRMAEAAWSISPPRRIAKLHVISASACTAACVNGTTMATVLLEAENGDFLSSAPLLLGKETAEWAYDAPQNSGIIAHKRPPVAFAKNLSEYFNKGAFYIGSIQLPTTAPVARLRISCVEAPANTFLAISHILLQDDDGSCEYRLGVEPTGVTIRCSNGCGSIRFLERRTAPGHAWMVPTAKSVGYADEFRDLSAEFCNRATDLGQMVLLDARQKSATRCAENNAPSPDTFTGTVRVKKAGPEDWSIRTYSNQAGYLVISNAYYPGWTAVVDKKPAEIIRANGAIQTLAVPAGNHKVKLHFETPGLRTGGLITFCVWAGGLLLLILPDRIFTAIPNKTKLLQVLEGIWIVTKIVS